MVRVQPTFVRGKKEGDVNSNSIEQQTLTGGGGSNDGGDYTKILRVTVREDSTMR